MRWCMVVYEMVHGGVRLCDLVCGGVRWGMVVCEGVRWCEYVVL